MFNINLPVKKIDKKFGFNFDFIKKATLLIKILYQDENGNVNKINILFSVGVILLNFLYQVIANFAGLIPSKFYNIFVNDDKSKFAHETLISSGIILSETVVLSAIFYVQNMLYIRFRNQLNYDLHKVYFNRIAFYEINCGSQTIDNPDQRLTQDIDKACNALGNKILPEIFIAPFVIAYYTWRTYQRSTWVGPLFIYMYFIVGSVINTLIISPVVDAVFRQECKEGDFRSKHMSVRNNAEQIAFYHSQSLEHSLTNQQLQQLITAQRRVVYKRLPVNWVANVFNYYGGIVSYLILAVPVFGQNAFDGLSPGDKSQAISEYSFYFIYLINAFSNLFDLANTVGTFAGTTHRIIELRDALSKIAFRSLPPAYAINSISEYRQNGEAPFPVVLTGYQNHFYQNYQFTPSESEKLISLEHSNVCAPNGDQDPIVLVRDLSLKIEEGKSILLTGRSGAGKSSIFRVLSKLWKPVGGELQLNIDIGSSKSILFVPQKPYCPNCYCTLRQQVVYPHFGHQQANNDAIITECLKSVELFHLIERCGGLDEPVDFDWMVGLSPGELQRLSFARVFFHHPLILFLDESTNALPLAFEKRLYDLLKEKDITYVSVGHRRSLHYYHDYELHLFKDGTYAYEKIDVTEKEWKFQDDDLASD